MKVIDFEKKGNVVRFYLGDDNCYDFCGDDWNDAPYEHNAGTVYKEYIKGYADVAFDFDDYVYEPGDRFCNSPFSKEDFKNRIAAVIVAENKECIKTVFIGDSLGLIQNQFKVIKLEIYE